MEHSLASTLSSVLTARPTWTIYLPSHASVSPSENRADDAIPLSVDFARMKWHSPYEALRAGFGTQ